MYTPYNTLIRFPWERLKFSQNNNKSHNKKKP